jgi:hypothetical protein
MLNEEPDVFTRLPAEAMTTSRLPIRRVMTAPNGIVASVTGALGLCDG